MPDDDRDGRLRGAPDNLLAPDRPRPAGFVRPPFTEASQLLPIATRFATEVAAYEALRQRGPHADVPAALVAAYQELLNGLERSEHAPPWQVVAQAQLGIAGLARVGRAADDVLRGTVETLASGVAARLAARGGPGWLQPVEVPGSDAIANATDDEARASTAIDAALGRLARLTALLDSTMVRQGAGGAAVDLDVDATIAVLEEAASAQTAANRGGRASRSASSLVERVQRHGLELFVAARGNRVDPATSRLFDLFDSIERTSVLLGGMSQGLREKYYGDLTPRDHGGHRTDITGGDLVDRIVQWFSSGAVVQGYMLTNLQAIITDPVAQDEKDPSVIFSLLMIAVDNALGMLPGYLSGLVGSALSGMRGPKPPAAAPHSYVTSDSPAPEPRLGKPGPLHGPGVARAAGQVKDGFAGEISDAALSRAKGLLIEGGASNLPLASRFIGALTDAAVLDVAARIERSQELRRSLEARDPVELQGIWDQLTAAAPTYGADYKASLVMEWANFIASVSMGRLAVGGSDGRVRIPLTVDLSTFTRVTGDPDGGGLTTSRVRRFTPDFRYGKPVLAGLSESALLALRRTARPLSSPAVYLTRIVELTVITQDGTTLPGGYLIIAPDGTVDASPANQAALAQVGLESPGTWSLAGTTGTSNPHAEAGAIRIAQLPDLTTADL